MSADVVRDTLTTIPESEYRRSLELLDKRNKDLALAKDENDRLQLKVQETRKHTVELENKLQEAESAKLSSKFREQHLNQEIELLKTNNIWLDNELSTKTTEFSTFRRDKSSQVSKLQSELDDALTNVEALTKSRDSLNDRVASLSRDLENALQREKTLKDTIASAEDNFNKEMVSQKRLVDLWERSTNEARDRVAELEESLEAQHDKEGQLAATWQTIAEKESERADEAESKLSDLESEIENLHATNEELQARIEQGLSPNGNHSTTITPSTPANNSSRADLLSETPAVALFSPSAQVISQTQKNGVSLTQLYLDFSKAKHQLEHERRRNQSLQQNFDELIQDLETRAPLIQAEREEAGRLKAELADMSMLLDETERDKEDAEDKLEKLATRLSDEEREVRIYRQQVHDLSVQVQNLVLQLRNQTEGAGLLSAAEFAELRQLMESTKQTSESDTAALISERLVTFKNIVELQEQNQNLLRVTRELGDKLEHDEAENRRKLQDLEGAAIEEKQKIIEKLSSDLKATKTKLESAQREKDMFRDMISKQSSGEQSSSVVVVQSAVGEGNVSSEEYNRLRQQYDEVSANYSDLQTVYKDLQQQYDAYRTETDVNIKTLNGQILQLSNDKTNLMQEVGRSKTQLELFSERLRVMTETFEASKQENATLAERSKKIQENAVKQELRTEQVATEIYEVKMANENLRNETANLKAEKSLFESIKNRLEQDNQSLKDERTRLTSMINSIQAMEKEREQSDSETRKRLMVQVDSLESELASTNKKLDSKIEELSELSTRKEYELKELQMKSEKLSEELSVAKSALSTSQAEQEKLQARISELTAEITGLEEKNAMYQREQEEEEFSIRKNLELEVRELKTQLESIRAELEEAKERAEQCAGIATAAEEALQSMNDSHDLYKATMEKEAQARVTQIDELKSEVTKLTESLTTTVEELTKTQDKNIEDSRKFEETKQNLEETIKNLHSSEETLAQNILVLRGDIREQSKLTKEAQALYEDELVKHSTTTQELQKMRSDYNSNVQLIESFREDAAQARNALEANVASWEEQKLEYEKEVKEMQTRCNDLVEQNTLLHNQFQSLNDQMARVRLAEAEVGSIGGTPRRTRRISLVSIPRPSGASGESSAEQITEEEAGDQTIVVDDASEEMREIIKFLRHEKELVDAQLELRLHEVTRLQRRLDLTSKELDDTRVQLAQEREMNSSSKEQAAQHEELIRKINDINILRESNSTLREEAKRSSDNVLRLEETVAKLNAEIAKIQDQLVSAAADVEAKEARVKMVEEDNERWKARTQQVLQKYERIDPVELQNLTNEVTNLKSQLESSTKERDELKADLVQVREEKENEGTVRNKKEAEMSAAIKAKEEEIEKIQAELKTVQDALNVEKQEAETRKARFQNLRNEFQTKLRKMRTDNTAAIEEKDKVIEAMKAEATSLHEKIKVFEQEISTLQSQIVEKDKQVLEAKAETEQAKAAAVATVAGSGQTESDSETKAAAVAAAEAASLAEKQYQEVSAELEKAKTLLSELSTANEERTKDLAKVQSELEVAQAAIKDHEAKAVEAATAAASAATASSGAPTSLPGSTTIDGGNQISEEDIAKKIAEARAEMEAKFEEEKQKREKEFETEKVETVNKTRESAKKESEMRTRLLQNKAERVEKEKNELQKKLEEMEKRLQGRNGGKAVEGSSSPARQGFHQISGSGPGMAPGRATAPPIPGTPVPASPATGAGGPANVVATTPTPAGAPANAGLATGIAQPTRTTSQGTGIPVPSKIQAPQTIPPPRTGVRQSIAQSFAQSQQQSSAAGPASSTVSPSAPAGSAAGGNGTGLRGTARSGIARGGSHLPQLQRPTNIRSGPGSTSGAGQPPGQTPGGQNHPTLKQQLQAPGGPRRGPQLMRPDQSAVVGAAAVGDSSVAGAAEGAAVGAGSSNNGASTVRDEAGQGQGIKRLHEEDGTASNGEGSEGAGSGVGGAPVALKRRREDAQ
ncbi:uncharacterized protein V1516DRAFT_661912 [Lipomyces oligophaga]|uniref:uncharacterized protein n=1 Tax=Lipomyces oligophaga TaxID=45792 RepID=UPI0034CEA61D